MKVPALISRRQWIGLSALIGSIGIMLLVSSLIGSRASTGTSPRVFGFSDAVDDVELTAQVPIVLVADVVQEQEISLADDPFLPAGWEADTEKALSVNSGSTRVKWRMNVVQHIKGSTASPVWIVTAAGDDMVDAVGPPGGSNYVPKVGDQVEVWLVPDPWFGQEHYILVRAKLA